VSFFHFVDEQEISRHWPIVTWSLCLLNIGVWLAMHASATPYDELIQAYAFNPSRLEWWMFFSGNAMHGNVFHLFGNLFFLVAFGENVEDVIGPVPFLCLYLLGGFAGDLTQVLANPAMTVPSLGASGCIATLAGAYGVMFWSSWIKTRVHARYFSIDVPVPAIVFVVGFLGLDVVQTVKTLGVLPEDAGVNYVAHGMGFLVGLAGGAWILRSGAVARYRSTKGSGNLLFGFLLR
jgi:membrane associated rhomboid family serine protease